MFQEIENATLSSGGDFWAMIIRTSIGIEVFGRSGR